MTSFAAAGRTSFAQNIKAFLPLLAYVAIALLVAVFYFSSFQQIENLILQEKLRDLGSIADMKARQIAEWREDYLREGVAHTHNSLIANEFWRWVGEGMSAGDRQRRLSGMLTELRHAENYKGVALLDRKGEVRLSPDEGFALDDEDMVLVRRAMEGGQPVFIDFHRSIRGKGIRIDLVAPLTMGDKSTVVGALVLQIDPEEYLYPLIRRWPMHSASAESLLVRQEGNDVLFLNEVRHKQGAALQMRIPMSNAALPAAMALRGATRAEEGRDYRGIPVVAEMRPVPGTPWHLVSKVDRDELLAPIDRLRQWSANLGLGFAVAGGVLVFFWLRRHQERLENLRVQHAAEIERTMLMKHFEYLTKYANDIIMLADESGNIVEANERAEQAYGFSRAELLGKRIPDLRDPEEDPAVFQQHLAIIKQLGELRFETVNVRKDGTRFPVESHARVIEVEGKRYLQGVIRDISERKQAEEALRRSETLLKKSQQMAHIGSWELDLERNILYWSDESYRIFEIDPLRFGASYEAFLEAVHPDDRDWVNRAYTDSVQSRKPYTIVHRLQFPDMRVKFVQEWCETHYDAAGKPLRSIGTTQDITVQQLAQSALRKTSQRIEDLFNHAPCGYHSLDKGGMVVQINDTELQWLGYTREEVVGKVNFVDLLAPGCRQLFRDNYPGFKRRGYVHDLEYELVRKDGSSFFVSLSATAVYDADGEYLMSRSSLFDITARKQAEAELRLQGAILSQMEEGVILIRAGSGTIVYANPKFDLMFGYASGEVIGLHVSNLNAPTTRSAEEEAREIISALQARGIWNGEILNRKKDGTPFWCRVVVSTFEHHDYGTVWVATHEDITARKLAEIRLEESEERFRVMADSAPIMIWIADAESQVNCRGCRYFNRRWHEFTGLPVEPAQSCAWQDIVHPDDREHLVDTYREAFLNRQAFDFEYRLRRGDGEYRWAQDSGVPRYNAEGEFVGFIGTCLDVTDNKLFDQMRAELEHAGRLQIAGEMASGLAHELSQPLSAASNYLSAGLRHMAERDWDRDRLVKTMGLAHAQAERAGAIINHLKDMVRKQRQERTMVDVNALIRDTLHFMEHEIRKHAVSVVMDFYTLPPARLGRVEIEQVLINLFKNAIDSMNAAPQRVLRVSTRIADSGDILVSVRDTGAGIAADELDRVFNPFQSSKSEGLGLGLPICRSLVENHGGRIWAERHGDEGAEFNFTLPVGAEHA